MTGKKDYFDFIEREEDASKAEHQKFRTEPQEPEDRQKIPQQKKTKKDKKCVAAQR